MTDETGDSVKDRFAARFGDGAADESDGNDETGKSEGKEKVDESAKTDESAKIGEGAKSSGANGTSVKSAWTNHSVYLDDELAADLSREYKRLDLALDEEYGLSIKKTRHYYPLVVRLGLDRLTELERKEVKEELEDL